MKRGLRRPERILASFIAATLLALSLVPLRNWGWQIQEWRIEQGISQPKLAESMQDIPVQELTGIVLGALFAGFRSQAANFCWWKSQQFWETDGMWPRVLPMMKAACALDPYFPEFWEVTGWHESYNLAAEYETRDLPQDLYVQMGLKTLHTGLRYNPFAIQLYEQLGWTHRDKMGDVTQAMEYARQAAMVYHVRPEITKQTAIIQPRFVAHMWEALGRPDEALLQYQELMLDYPRDTVGIGASLTIRDRYLPAWRALRAGDQAEAERRIREHLRDDPTDEIALHMLGTLKETQGDVYGALAAWEAAAWLWKDTPAQRRYVDLLRATKRDALQLPGIVKYNLLISKRTSDYLLQPRELEDGTPLPWGAGVTLLLKSKSEGVRTLPPNYQLRVGDTIIARPYMIASVKGASAVFYFSGREIARRTEPPYEFTITPDMRMRGVQGQSDILVKVEFWVPGEQPDYPPRFDLREIYAAGESGTAPRGPEPGAGGPSIPAQAS